MSFVIVHLFKARRVDANLDFSHGKSRTIAVSQIWLS
jgi:hypothetical protein